MIKKLKYFLIRLFYLKFRRSKVIKIGFLGKLPFTIGEIVSLDKNKKAKYVGKSLFIEFNQ